MIIAAAGNSFRPRSRPNPHYARQWIAFYRSPARQRLPSGNSSDVRPRLRVGGDPRKSPAQLDSSRQLAFLVEDGADCVGIGLGHEEHPAEGYDPPHTAVGKRRARVGRFGIQDCGRSGVTSWRVKRDLIRARTGEGRARAIARGVKMGRKPKMTPHQMKEALKRRDAGEPMRNIAKSFNVSHSTISRLAAWSGRWDHARRFRTENLQPFQRSNFGAPLLNSVLLGAAGKSLQSARRRSEKKAQSLKLPGRISNEHTELTAWKPKRVSSLIERSFSACARAFSDVRFQEHASLTSFDAASWAKPAPPMPSLDHEAEIGFCSRAQLA
jgi:hypothetical protein